MRGLALHWQIAIALLLALVAGAATGPQAMIAGVPWQVVFRYVGTLFLNALTMLVVPLIVASIISAVANIGSGTAIGRLGLRTLVYYLITSLLAVLVGLAAVNLVTPGIVDGAPVRDMIGLTEPAAAVRERVDAAGAGDLAGLLERMIPTNIVAAAAEGELLGLIFFSLLFGYFLTRLEGPGAEAQRQFWNGLYEVMLAITELVIRFAPLGVFGLVAATVADTGASALRPLAWFMATVFVALAVHALVTLPLLLWVVGGLPPGRHLRVMAPALLTAFSTASSAATLPLTMERVERGAGVSRRTSGLVLPLGATVNMDGTALFECVAALFIAQAYGIDLSFAQQLLIVITALATSVGVAGIPSASMVAIAVILKAVGLPLEGLGLILAVDRILDMLRTAVNVFGDSCGAVLIARWEGEQGILRAQGQDAPAPERPSE